MSFPFIVPSRMPQRSQIKIIVVNKSPTIVISFIQIWLGTVRSQLHGIDNSTQDGWIVHERSITNYSRRELIKLELQLVDQYHMGGPILPRRSLGLDQVTEIGSSNEEGVRRGGEREGIKFNSIPWGDRKGISRPLSLSPSLKWRSENISVLKW